MVALSADDMFACVVLLYSTPKIVIWILCVRNRSNRSKPTFLSAHNDFLNQYNDVCPFGLPIVCQCKPCGKFKR